MEEKLQTEPLSQEVDKPQNTKKYLLNVVYFSPRQSEANGPVILNLEVQQIFFEKYKEAIEKFKSISRTKTLELITPVGKVNYNIVSIEMIDLNKYTNILIEQAKKESEEKLQESDQNIQETEDNGAREE